MAFSMPSMTTSTVVSTFLARSAVLYSRAAAAATRSRIMWVLAWMILLILVSVHTTVSRRVGRDKKRNALLSLWASFWYS